jgi:hypothetical protein
VVEKTRKVLECDYPGCTSEDDVERITVTIGQRKLMIDLDPDHQAVVTIADVAKYAHRKPRSRGVDVFDPEDIPRTASPPAPRTPRARGQKKIQ